NPHTRLSLGPGIRRGSERLPPGLEEHARSWLMSRETHLDDARLRFAGCCVLIGNASWGEPCAAVKAHTVATLESPPCRKALRCQDRGQRPFNPVDCVRFAHGAGATRHRFGGREAEI